jgi:hypothetical protein
VQIHFSHWSANREKKLEREKQFHFSFLSILFGMSKVGYICSYYNLLKIILCVKLHLYVLANCILRE